MKKAVFCLALCLTSALNARSDSRPEARPNKKLCGLTDFFRSACDFFGEESLGIKALSHDNEQFIQEIINDLEMQDYCIELRSMSNYAQQGFNPTDIFVLPLQAWGRSTILTMPSIFGKKFHTQIFISEEWFSTLTADEKQALIRQELMQLKLGQHAKKFLLGIASFVIGFHVEQLIRQELIRNSNLPDNHKLILSQKIYYNTSIQLLALSLINGTYSRMCQKEADIAAVKNIGSKEGFISLIKNMQEHTEDVHSKFSLKHLINSIINPFRALVRFKPSFEDRIEYIETL